MTNEEMIAEIFKIYNPGPNQEHPGYRAYYDENNHIVCFSQEILDMPFVQVPKEWYETYRPDLFKIVNGKIIKREQYYQNKLQLKPNGTKFASIHNDQQFAVGLDFNGPKDLWDINV